MSPPLHQQIWSGIKFYMRICVFLFHVGLLVPGIVFWVIFLLLHGDMTAFALVSDNLISRYLAADIAEQQNFLDLVAVGSSVMFFIVAGFRWRGFQRDLHRENIERGQDNEK
tara:strand:+ start:1562 stop:1897 length:336 start_codon:yes stop_codon:yes gene_type:complete